MSSDSSPFGSGSNALLLATSLLAAKACNDEKLCQRVEQDPTRFIAMAGLPEVGEAAFLASFQAMLAQSRTIERQSQQAASAARQLHEKIAAASLVAGAALPWACPVKAVVVRQSN